jgi:hypothetical protein
VKHNPDNPLWPAWKVTLLALLMSLAVIMAIAGFSGSSSDSPERAGERAGQKFGWLMLTAPLAAYIVQKLRIDNWNRANPPPGPQNDSRML